MLSKSLIETVVYDWVDLGTAREMGEEIHVTYCRKMEANWGPEHTTTVPEDYAQHVILGVSLMDPVSGPPYLSPFLLYPVPYSLSLVISGPLSPVVGYPLGVQGA